MDDEKLSGTTSEAAGGSLPEELLEETSGGAEPILTGSLPLRTAEMMDKAAWASHIAQALQQGKTQQG